MTKSLNLKVFRGSVKYASFKSDIDAITYARTRSEVDRDKTIRWTVVSWHNKQEIRIFVRGIMLAQDLQGTWDKKTE